jgi:hypothetical protein
MSIISENLDRLSIPSGDPSPSLGDIISARESNQMLEDHLGLAKVKRFEIDTRLRKYLAYSFTIIIFLWLASVICILFFNDHLLRLNLSDTVLVTLLTTTSVNVIGMMLIILKNLFPERDEHDYMDTKEISNS